MGVDQPDPVSSAEEYVGTARAGYAGRAAMLDHEPEPASGLLGAVDHAMHTAVNDARAQAQTTAWARSQAARLEHGLVTQSAPDFGGQFYPGYPTRALHDMVTTNIDPGGVGAAGAAYNGIGNTYARIAQDLGSAASASESGWVGAAGDSARTFLAGMARWADTTAQGAQLAGDQLGMQAEAAQLAMHSMPTPVEPPTAADVRQVMLGSTLNPAAGAARLDQQFQAAQQAHAEAVRVVQTYDANLAAVGNTMPAFDLPPAFNPTAGSGNGAVGGAGIPVIPDVNGAQGPRPEVGGADQVSPAQDLAGPASPATRPGQAAVPAGQSGSVAARNPTMTTQAAAMPASSLSAGSTTSSPEGGMSSAGPVNLPGGQVGGPDLLVSPNAPGGRPIGALGTPEGGRVGANEVAVRATSGPAGGPTPGLLAGRGGRGDADKERERPSYLENPDPDATFGTDQIVAPPVIGA